MGNTFRGGKRPDSAMSQSNARDILKKRSKPYRIELRSQQARNKRQRPYRGKPPAGFVFVPLGTPDLADLCKKLSEERDLEVQIVNAAASSNPNAKISNQIRRIGYHFRDEIVEDACSELNYTILEGEFVKEGTIMKRHNDNKVAKIMEKYGIHSEIESEETPEKVSAVIREIFPAIPQDDLDQIVNHAWEAGTDRVGNVGNIDLPRKAQLAVTARIRHKYTDYDVLLRTFDWRACRNLVEQDCLKKIIEWRGDDNADDSTLQDIIRETIVIDDESSNEAKTHRRRTLDTDVETGSISDMSIEITHRRADADDLRGEESEELQHPYFEATRPQKLSFDRRNDLAKAKIEAIRGRIQQSAQPRQHSDKVLHTWVNADRNGVAPEEIVINGVRMIKAPSQDSQAHATVVSHVNDSASFAPSSYRSTAMAAMPQYQAPTFQPLPTVPFQEQQAVSTRPAPLNYIRLDPFSGQYGQPQRNFHDPSIAHSANQFNQGYQVVPRPSHGSPAAVQYVPYAQMRPNPQGQHQYPR